MRKFLISAAAMAAAAALAGPAAAQTVPNIPPRVEPPAFGPAPGQVQPPRFGPGAPRRGPVRVGLAHTQTGPAEMMVSPGLTGSIRLEPREAGEYWLIVENWAPGGAHAVITVGETRMQATLPPCLEVCGRYAPVGFVVGEGEAVTVRVTGVMTPSEPEGRFIPLF